MIRAILAVPLLLAVFAACASDPVPTVRDPRIDAYLAELDGKLYVGMYESNVWAVVDLYPFKTEKSEELPLDPDGKPRLRRPSDPPPRVLWTLEWDLRPNIDLPQWSDVGIAGGKDPEHKLYPKLSATFEGPVGERKLVSWRIFKNPPMGGHVAQSSLVPQ